MFLGDIYVRKTRGFLLACAAAATVFTVLPATPANALSSGLAFSADHLSAWQANGVSYAVAGSKGKVVVGGSFTQIRPPEGGTGTARAMTGLAILNADTGAPDTCQLPATIGSGTATVYALNTSPDGNTVYVGGNFSAIGGVSVSRVAAIDVGSCAVKPLRVSAVSAAVYALASTDTTLYMGGGFTSVGGQTRQRFAAVNSTSGALLPWIANADAPGRAVAVSPDRSKVVIGGDFFNVNTVYSHSIAVVDATSGANLKNYPAGFIPNNSVTKTIAVDETGFYIGNEGTGGGVFDGRAAFDWSTLDQRWRDTCLGATQAVLPYQGTLYSAHHAHDCNEIGEQPDGKRYYFLAQKTTDRSRIGWYPTANDGIGEGIGPRALAAIKGTSGTTYLYATGEFTKINGIAQQSITRYGPTDTGSPLTPFIQAESLVSNAVQVRVLLPTDADDDTLTYTITRNNVPIYTAAARSSWWSRPQLTYTDTTAEPGRNYTYRVVASDGINALTSGGVIAAATTKATDYPSQVIDDGAQLYWRYSETSGTRLWNRGVDSTQGLNGLLVGGTALGASGAVGTDPSATFDGVNDLAWSDQLHTGPSVYSVETWIKTTTGRGGKIIGFGNGRVRTDTNVALNSGSYDRHVYMDNTGRLTFGAYNGTTSTVRSPQAYNDGSWHHIVATQGPSGMTLFVDGARVGRNAIANAQSYKGVWRVGGDNVSGWPNQPSSFYFAGQIDDTAVYEGSVLSPTQVANHYGLSGRTPDVNPVPTNAYGAAVYRSDPDFYWPLSETSGDAEDASLLGARPGTVGSAIVRRQASPIGDGFGVGTANDVNSLVATSPAQPNPGTYATELWFTTTSTTGGKLIGYEDSATGGGSGNYDKQTYLTNDGTLVFGVYNGSVNTLTSRSGLNDGRWHHVVASQDSTGMKLFVDGVQVAANGVTTNQVFNGYWRIGGGNLNAWPSRPTDSFVTGTLDEAAVYDHALTSAEVLNHFALGVDDSTAPSAPTALTATANGAQVDLTWTAATDDVAVTRYQVYRGTTEDFTPASGNRIGESATTGYSDTTATAGAYFYKVTALDAAGNEGAAATAGVVLPDTTAPTAATGLSATANGTGAELAWTAATDDVGVTAYDVHRGRTAGFTVDATSRIGETDGTTFEDASTRELGDYYYVVVARDAAGNRSPASNEAKYAPADTVAPSTPTGLTAAVDGDDVTVSWTAATDDVAVTGYRVYRGSSENFTADSSSLLTTVTTTTYADTNRPAGTRYYKVVAVDAAGNRSAATDAVAATVVDSTAPSAPTDLATSVSGSTIALTWTAATDDVAVTRYDIHRSATAGFTAGAATKIGQSTTTSYSDANRPTGTWYYRVVAVDAAGNTGDASAAASGRVASERVTVSLQPVADTMVAQNAQTTKYGTNNQLSTRAPGANTELQAYLRFDLSSLPSGATIVGANLKVTTSTDPTANSTGATQIKRLNGAFTEASTIWTNRPTDLGATLGQLDSLPALKTAYTAELDVSTLTTLDSGQQLSLALTSTSADNMRINSREGASVSGRPSLTVTYEQ